MFYDATCIFNTILLVGIKQAASPDLTPKSIGVDLLSIGKFEAEDGSDVIIEEQCESNYSRFLFRDSHLMGSILYGDTAISGGVKKAIENKDDFSGFLNKQSTAADVWDFFA